ncbi:MAG: hypothetical protein DRO15_03620 [Thermoprotei archaeon]|nr:MAG: hypothetical protein DRO15_03620 [Thermoprotei archaeon]
MLKMQFSDMLFLLLILLLLLPLIISMLTSRQRKQVELPKKTFTIIECIKGDYKETREFRLGDFVGKVVGTCKNCGSDLVISLIYTEVQKIPGARSRTSQHSKSHICSSTLITYLHHYEFII